MKLNKITKLFTKTRRRKVLASLLTVLVVLTTFRFIFEPKPVKAATVELSTTESTVQIDVANHYRAILQKGSSSNYLIFYDRAENDSNPEAVYRQPYPAFYYNSTTYGLAYDVNRKTTVLESNDVRIKVRVEGCFVSSGVCLTNDGGKVITVTNEYTFTTEVAYVKVSVDFGPDGLALTSSDSVYSQGGYVNLSGETYADSIIYGDGETEAERSTDGSPNGNEDVYVVFQGTGGYQDLMTGTMLLNGDKHLSNSSNGGGWFDYNEAQSKANVVYFNDTATQTLYGVGDYQFFLLFKPQSDLNTEEEREAVFNDITNPDVPTYTTGSEWDDMTSPGGMATESGKLAPAAASPGLYFDGTDDYVNAGDPSTLQLTSSGTVSTWINVKVGDGDPAFVCKGDWNNDRDGFCLASHSYGGQFVGEIADGSTAQTISTTSTNYNDGKWHHVVFTWNGSYLNLYVDGSVAATPIAQTIDAVSDVYNLEFGRNPHDGARHYFKGYLDEVRIYNYALTESQIQQNMYAQIDPSTDSGLVGYWHFNENTGQYTHDETTNNNDATLGPTSGSESNDPKWQTGFVPDQYNEAEGAYTIDADGSQISLDLDAGSNASTLASGAITSGSTSITVDSTNGFDSSGAAYINGDKFTYTGTTSTTFTGIPSSGENSVIGHADNSVVSASYRHDPFYKIRKYRSNFEPTFVTMEGKTLTQTYDYNASLKPMTDAYFADELTWYSPLESLTSDVGDDATQGTASCTFTTGKYGKGVQCDDTNEWIYVPMANNVNSTTGTIEFWYQETTNATAYESFFSSSKGTDQFQLRRNGSDTNIQFVLNGSTYSTWSDTINVFDGSWHHIRLTYDTTGNSIYLYIDGVSEGQSTTDHDAIDIGSYNLKIGNTGTSGNSADGIIDEFKVYNTALSPDQIAKGGNTDDSDEYLADEESDYTLDFEADDASNRGEYVFLGSDSMFNGVNVDLATDGVDNGGIFSDDFESGGISNWDSSNDPDGDELNVTTASAYTGSYGVQVDIDDDDAIYIRQNNIGDKTSFKNRFAFNPNSILNNHESDTFAITINCAWTGDWTPAYELFLVIEDSEDYSIKYRGYNDAAGYSETSYYTISDNWHLIEVEFEQSSGSDDGYYKLWIDGELKETLSGIDNDTVNVDHVSFLANFVGGSSSELQGTLYFDDYASWDGTMEYDWEYWDGSSWSDLTVTGAHGMRTEAFLDDGAFWWDDPPTNWRPYSVNGSTDLYWIRGHLAGGEYSTSPIENRIRTDILLLQYYDDLTEGDQTLITPSTVDSPTPVIAYWKFDEGYGTTAHDSMGYNLAESDATFGPDSAAPTWVEESRCLSGKCLEFDGSNDYLTATGSAMLNSIEGYEVSFSAWIRHGPQTSGQDVIVSKYETTGADGGYKLLMESDGDITFGVDDDNSSFPRDKATSTAANYDDNEWHHIVGVKDASSIKLYIDGLLVNTDDKISTDGSLENDDTFFIGIDGDGTSNPFDGFIDEVKVYRYALSESQVKTDYQGGKRGLAAQMGGGQDDWLTNGLVGYWKLDETSSPATDSSGEGNNGTWNVTADDGTGKFGNGIVLDGDSDYISMSNTGGLQDIENEDMTFAAWVNANTLGADRDILTKGNMSQAIELRYDLGDQNFQFNIRDNDSWKYAKYSQDSPSTSTWYHVVGIRRGDNLEIYVNGIKGATTTTFTADLNSFSDESWAIGRVAGADTRYWYGTVDEVRIYNRALSPAEVQKLYNWAPGPVGYWKMDENTGTTAYDSSGNNHTGTLTDGPQWATGKFGSGTVYQNNTTQRTVVSDHDNFELGIGSTTLEAWVKTTSTGITQHIIRKDNGSGLNGYTFRIESNDYLRLSFSDSDSDADSYSSSTITDGNWHYVAAVYDRSSDMQYLYVDGVLNDSDDPNISGNVTNTNDLQFGGWTEYTSTETFNGTLDDVRIYNYARTPSQIVEDMNAGHPAPGSPVGSAIGHWSFDEGYGDTAYDSGTGGNNGNLGGATTCPQSGDSACPSWTNDGKFGKALEFDNSGTTDDYVDVGNDASLDIDGKSFSFSLWAKPGDDLDYIGLIGKAGADVTRQSLMMRITNVSQLLLSFYSDDLAVIPHTNFASGVWSHITATYDVADNSRKVYINGVLAGSDTAGGPISNTSTGSWTIGSYESGSGGYFDGTIDEVQIFNSALTGDQVKLLYNQGKAAVFGATSTDSSGSPSYSSTNSYCPPGQSTACVGPVAEWKFDENTGQYAQDTSENNNTGTLGSGSGVDSADPQWTTGKIGNALAFDGNDYIPIANFSQFNAFTVNAWVHLTSDPSGDVKIFTDGNGLSCGINGSDNKIESARNDGTWKFAYSNTAAFVNTWHFVTCTYDGSNLTIYLDGKPGTPTAIGGSYSGTTTAYIGSLDVAQQYFPGKIDEVRIYNYARTPAQIAWDYNQGAPVAQYDFDECSGTTLNNTAPSASGADSGNDGTITIGGSGTQDNAGTCSSGDTGDAWYNGRSGKFNGSLSFDGSDDYVSVTDASEISPISQLSLSAWVKPSNVVSRAIVVKNNSYRLVTNSSGYPVCQIHNGSGWQTAATGTTALSTTSWQNVTCTYDATSIKVYVDGVLKGQTPLTTAIADNSNALEFARDSGSTYTSYTGQLDDVRVFNYALTPLQVKNLYNGGSAVRFGP